MNKSHLWEDAKTAVSVFRTVRELRKSGKNVKVEPRFTLPVVKTSYWGSTMEGCMFIGPKWQPLLDVFDSFDDETKHSLTFTPEDGKWSARARFWREQLKSALPTELYYEAMSKIYRHYTECVHRRKVA